MGAETMMLTWNMFKSDFRDSLESTIGMDAQGNSYSKSFCDQLRLTRMAVERQNAAGEKALMVRIQRSLSCFLSSYCALLDSGRAIPMDDHTRFRDALMAAPAERGIVLDFLLSALNYADQVSHRYQIDEIDVTHSLYNNLVQTRQKKGFLYWMIDLDRSPRRKRDTPNVIHVYHVDLPYLEFYHGENRKFPWQRHSQTTSTKRYAFTILGQRFESPAIRSGEESAYAELLDWYWREKYWGINLSAELSGYAPGIHKTSDYAKLHSFWGKIRDAGVLGRLMKFPYPAYRFSFMRSLLSWYFANEYSPFPERTTLDNLPLIDLIDKIGKLPPSVSSYGTQSDIDCRLKELSVEALENLMKKALFLSILSCMTEYRHAETIHVESAMSTLEDDAFWCQYKSAVYHLICKELQTFYIGDPSLNDSASEKLRSLFPLILMPSNSDHAQRLLDSLSGSDRCSDLYARSYSEIQELCYTQGMDLAFQL